MTTCRVCHEVLGEIWSREDLVPYSRKSLAVGQRTAHHPTFAALQLAAENCRMCELILGSIIQQSNLESMLKGEKHEAPIRIFIKKDSDFTTAYYRPLYTDCFWRKVEVECDGQSYSCDKTLCFYGIQSNGGKNAMCARVDPLSCSLEERLSVVRQWIDDCAKNHKTCKMVPAKPHAFPTRLIDVGPPDGSKEPFLFETFGQRGSYATLSHCWGTSPAFTTTRSNFAEMKKVIPLVNMPKCFQDVVLVVRALNIRYIWIDSLCIIQGDVEDWERESNNMAMIYTKSFLTIAATSASGHEESCFWPHVPWAQVHHDDADFPTPITFVGHVFDHERNIRFSPLNRRAWVLQEMLLSYRVLHLARDQLYWICAERAFSEDYTIDKYLGVGSYGLKEFHGVWINRYYDIGYNSPREMRNVWWRMIENFSSRSLSKESDRLPAIAGIVQVITRRTHWKFLAGLWEEDLYYNLLWYVIGERRAQRIEGMPTWSWASVDCQIRRPNDIYMTTFVEFEKQLDFVHSNLKWEGRPLVSRLMSTELSVRARARRAILEIAPSGTHVEMIDHLNQPWRGPQCNIRHLPPEESPEKLGKLVGYCGFDCVPMWTSVEVTVLEVAQTRRTPVRPDNETRRDGWEYVPPVDLYFALILQADGVRDGCYRRIGVGVIEIKTAFFEGYDPLTLLIV